MRNLIYWIVLGFAWSFSACQDVTVGYLVVDETAGYAKDTMYIVTNTENELQRLENILATFYSNNISLKKELEEKEATLQETKEQKYEELDERLTPIWDAMEEEDADFDALMDQQMAIEEEIDEKYDPILAEIETNIAELKEQQENLAKDMGIESPEILKTQIEEYQMKVDYKLAWVSSKIEGVQGTEPVLYSVVRVKTEKEEDIAKFMENVEVLGAGMVCVKYDSEIAGGTYTITLKIENERRSRILEDVFTIIAKEVPAEEPIPMPEE